MKNLAGKKLREAVAEMDEDTILHIGSSSGYVFVGNKALCNALMDGISEDYHKFFERSRRSSLRKIKRYADIIESLDVGTKDYLKRVEPIISKIQTIGDYVIKTCKILKDFEPMMERTVMDAYERVQGDGIAIIIKGSESGKYWDKEEWDANHKGELNVQEQRGVS